MSMTRHLHPVRDPAPLLNAPLPIRILVAAGCVVAVLVGVGILVLASPLLMWRERA
jgi:hypothetical protein